MPNRYSYVANDPVNGLIQRGFKLVKEYLRVRRNVTTLPPRPWILVRLSPPECKLYW